MDSKEFTESVPDIDRCVQTAMFDGHFSAAALIASVGGQVFHRKLYGTEAIVESRPVRLRDPTYFDLGSLTLPLASGLAALYLTSRSQIDLNATLDKTLADFRRPPWNDVHIDMLLDHSAGFPSDRRLHLRLREEEEALPKSDRLLGTSAAKVKLIEFLAESPLDYAPGSFCQESTLSGMVLGWVIENLSGLPLELFLERHLYRPLGLQDDLFFVRLDDPKRKVKTARRRFAASRRCAWRGELIQGEVDDENAWAMGGVAGHAGLFGSVDGVFNLVLKLWQSHQGEGRDFPGGTVARFWRRSRRVPHTTRALGWDTPPAHGASSGKRYSRNSVGVDGDTGCSIWVDLSSDIIGVFLCNAAHEEREGKEEALADFRPRLFDRIAQHGETIEPEGGRARGAAAFSDTKLKR